MLTSDAQSSGTATAAAWTVAGCFAALTVAKLASPDGTLQVFREVWHFGPTAADVGFIALIAAEAVLVALLAFRPWRTFGFLASAAFLLVVSVSPLRQLIEGSTAGCGCGGSATASATPVDHALALGRNGFLVALTIFGLMQDTSSRAQLIRLRGLFALLTSTLGRNSCSDTASDGAATSAASPP